MNLRKTLVAGLIISFAFSIYQIFVQPSYHQALEDSGKNVGAAETALGFFLTYIVIVLVIWFLNRGKH